MTYRIARNGQVFGPYNPAEVQRYLASGNILPSDLAQAEGTDDWLPVEQLFPAAPVPTPVHPGGLPRLFPDPPDLPWWVALLLGVVTSIAFFVVWDVVEAAWLRKVQRSSTALWLYIAVAALYVMKLPMAYHSIRYNLGYESSADSYFSGWLVLISIIVLLVARFQFRSELLRHFNSVEPIGLQLSGLMTFFFGGLYFQYHFNRINEVKRALRVSVP